MIEVDSSGKQYLEVSTSPDEQVRLTIVPAATAGYGRDSVRVQIRASSGQLRQGPEIPVDCLDQVIGGIVHLLLHRGP